MIRGLTILQPWATAIARGPKRVENRTWKPSPQAMREGVLVAVHAGKRWADDRDCRALFDIWPEAPRNREAEAAYPLGAIVAVARVARVAYPYEFRGSEQARWATGPECWVLENVRALPEPLPCAGAQGLWRIPTTIHARLVDALGGSITDEGGLR